MASKTEETLNTVSFNLLPKFTLMKQLLLLILGAFIAIPVLGRDFTYEYEGQTLTYTVIDEDAKTCKTKDGDGDYNPNVSGRLIIPSTAKDGAIEYTVTAIGNSAFSYNNISSVEIPNTVVAIGNGAFEQCASLTTVNIPNSVVLIENCAFIMCSELSSVKIPDSVKLIGERAFEECLKLTSVVIPNSVTEIGWGCFYGCTNLMSVQISNIVSTIGDYMFYGCKNLKEICIPDGVTAVGEYAFHGCTNLNVITIPSHVASIGDYAFTGCHSLNRIEWGNSILSIGDYAFYSCKSLVSIEIPNTVTEIGNYAFASCNSLKKIVLSNAVSALNEGAFWRCTGLESIVLPNSVTTIGELVFADCTGLTTIAIGRNMDKIGSEAFNNCRLKDLFITTQRPPWTYNTFDNYSATLHLQGQKAVTAYNNSTVFQWNKFENIEVMVEPTKISTNTSTISGKAGDTFQLTATVLPEDVTLPYIFWRSTNSEIATVDNHGLVTFNSDATTGTCKIIAETLYANGPVAEVIVTDIPSGVEDVFDESFSSDEIDFNAPVEVYNLHGVMVGHDTNHLATGIYVVRQGKNVKKIIVG